MTIREFNMKYYKRTDCSIISFMTDTKVFDNLDNDEYMTNFFHFAINSHRFLEQYIDEYINPQKEKHSELFKKFILEEILKKETMTIHMWFSKLIECGLFVQILSSLLKEIIIHIDRDSFKYKHFKNEIENNWLLLILINDSDNSILDLIRLK